MKNWFALAILLAALGCKGDTKTETSAAQASAEPVQDVSGDAAGQPPSAADSAPVLGIPECDQYSVDYFACSPKFPEAVRSRMLQQFTRSVEGWKKSAVGAESRRQLTAACLTAHKKAAEMFSSLKCTWKLPVE